MPRFPARAFLFDLDGTLIQSIEAVDRAWTRWFALHGLDPVENLPKIHGRRSRDSVSQLLQGADVEAEDALLRKFEREDTDGVVPLPGTLDLLASISPEHWTIVTSGTSDVAQARLNATGLPIFPTHVYAEDVQHGKPHPEPYLKGAERLGVDPAHIVAFEDTQAGINAIRAAGMIAIAVGKPLEQAHAWVPDPSHILIERIEDQYWCVLRGPL